MRAVPLALCTTLLAAAGCRSGSTSQPVEPRAPPEPRLEQNSPPLPDESVARRTLLPIKGGGLEAELIPARRTGAEALSTAVREDPGSESVERRLWSLWNGSDPNGGARYLYLDELSRMRGPRAGTLARGWARLAKAVWVHGIGAPDFVLREHKLTLDALGALESDYPGTNIAEHAQALRRIVESLTAGTPAPALPLVDLGGRPMTLGVELGHPALLVFWDPGDDCSARVLKGIYQLSTRIDTLGVQFGGAGADVFRLLKDSPQLWRTALAAEQAPALLAGWGVRALPATFLIDEHGRVRAVDLYASALDRAVRELKAGTLGSALGR